MGTNYMHSSHLWRATLGEYTESSQSSFIEKLRVSLESFRKNCEILAVQIGNDLPHFTVHDITHIDSLWEIASLIVGHKYQLNPAEAYVLGGAILIHDLGMAAAAYVDGIDSLYSGEEWNDIVYLKLKQVTESVPTLEDIKNPPDKIKQAALEQRLRQMHAIQAEQLPFINWDNDEGKHYRLLEDTELLEHFGVTIGLVASSHWWSVDEIEGRLDYVLGSPPSYPSEWKVDVLKIACILRCADIAHIDSRRAPSLLRSIKKPVLYSLDHWKFQERISRPVPQHDLLVYTARQRFTENDATAWWMAFDTLRSIDREIKNTNQLLRESNRNPFLIQGVKGVDSPAKLAEHIHVHNWKPVDTSIHISDIPSLVKNLGGAGLYGEKPHVAIRELIQNARDAIIARRRMHNKDNTWGSIIVKFEVENNGVISISVSDDGIGMTTRTITEKLLDFGKSYWGSSTMLEEQPGLMASGFSSVGRFGIGFFSAFMLGNRVEVITRSIHKGPDGTLLLKFGNDLSIKPILLNVNRGQQFNEPGTEVKVYLKNSAIFEGLIASFQHEEGVYSEMDENQLLEVLCRKIAPALDVDLYVKIFDEPKKLIAKANDWESIEPEHLILRTLGLTVENAKPELKEKASYVAPLLKPITDFSGKLLGRVAVVPFQSDQYLNEFPVMCSVACGGLESNSFIMITGILLGDVSDASRNRGIPIVSSSQIAEWATEQANDVWNKYDLDIEVLFDIADLIIQLGGDVGELPICDTNYGALSYSQIQKYEWPDKIAILRNYERKSLVDIYEYDPSVIIIDFGGLSITNSEYEWPKKREYFVDSLDYQVLKAISEVKHKDINLLPKKRGKDETWIVGKTREGQLVRYNTEVYDFT
ncbi:HD domain-containing protein [Paenibacillus alginolyticus]|uniref:ATP-binding protein n=1 Tax=Paenibacillus alginolyticus TaxID=59839 RepID=A0ABT4GFS8_9BACL|nr:ATP-binding protein [Paenibacillus alginolyticus]MCY9695001.1 ATP-binding protein [Paenibacillus alginolyticus]MEC0145021.1 ATP-binding protein [Paenibacillus alginolyticus]